MIHLKFTDLNHAKRHFTVSTVKQYNDLAGGYFFSKDTMKFFGNRLSDFKVWVYPNGNVFIFEKSGTVRQLKSDGSISTPLHYRVGFQRGDIVNAGDKWHFDSIKKHVKYESMHIIFDLF